MLRRAITVLWLFVSLAVIAMWGLEVSPLAIRIALTILYFACSFGVAYWAYQNDRKNMPANPGLCPTCGYDLRATPYRCPECGTPAFISSKPK